MKKYLKGLLFAFAILFVSVSANNVVSAGTDEEVINYANEIMIMDEEEPIPMLTKLEQISDKEIRVTYDRDVDKNLGKKSTNYWVQDVKNAKAMGVATLGKDDKVSNSNSLTDQKVKIESMDGSASTFVLTFNDKIEKGAEYKLIICYVTVEGAPPYEGDNGSATFIGK